MTDHDLISRMLVREGGDRVTHAAHDRGGATKYGITRGSLQDWRGHTVTDADVSALTEGEAREIYQHRYLDPWLFVPDADLKELLFDCAVLHGLGRARRFLQRALGVTEDGIIGPETEQALARANLVDVLRGCNRRRVEFLGETISADPTQARFAAGWLRRAASFL